jgi:hypothetical protein
VIIGAADTRITRADIQITRHARASNDISTPSPKCFVPDNCTLSIIVNVLMQIVHYLPLPLKNKSCRTHKNVFSILFFCVTTFDINSGTRSNTLKALISFYHT